MVSWTRSRLAELDPGGDDEVVAEFVASLQVSSGSLSYDTIR